MTPSTSEPLWFGAAETRDVLFDEAIYNINTEEKYSIERHSSVERF